MQDEIMNNYTFENAILVFSTFCKDRVSRKVLLQNLASGAKNTEIRRLRDKYRE